MRHGLHGVDALPSRADGYTTSFKASRQCEVHAHCHRQPRKSTCGEDGGAHLLILELCQLGIRTAQQLLQNGAAEQHALPQASLLEVWRGELRLLLGRHGRGGVSRAAAVRLLTRARAGQGRIMPEHAHRRPPPGMNRQQPCPYRR